MQSNMSANDQKQTFETADDTTRRDTSTLRGEAFENGVERDPADAVLRAIPLKIDPALVKAVEHPDAGQWMFHSL
jgi:hypothetical protein